MLVARRIVCPYCGETFETAVDTSGGSQEYIEDCQICCRPIVFHARVDHEGVLSELNLGRDDE
jgi:hypothetical protein